MTIKRIMIVLLAILSLLLLESQGELFHQTYQKSSAARRALIGNEIISGMLDSSSVWAIERGLTNAALNSQDANSSDMIAKIHAVRAQADTAFEDALKKIDAAGMVVEDQYKTNIERSIASLASRRKAVDAELGKVKAERDSELIGKWMPTITTVIMETQKLRINLASQALNDDAVLGKDAMIRHSVWLMTEYAGRERGMLAGIIASGEPIMANQLQQLLTYRGRIEEGWSILTNIHMTEKELALFKPALDAAKADYFGSFEDVRERVYADSRANEPYTITAATWMEQSTNAIAKLDAIKEISAQSIKVALEQSHAAANASIFLHVLSLLASLLAVTGALWVVLRRIVRSINTLRAAMGDISMGALDRTVPYLQRKDEIGGMAQSVEVFRQNGLEKVRLEKEAKEAELRAEQEKKALMQKLADDFEQGVQGIINMVAAAATQLYQTAEGMKNSVASVSAESGTASSSSRQASDSVASVAAAAEEMSASIKEIAAQVAKSSNMTSEAVSKAHHADQTIQVLSDTVGQISTVTEMISNIASQINLLALNATIESARAGEAGKGFAVVASEVKNLATQAAKATEEIEDKIRNVGSVSQEVVQVIKDIQDAIGNISHYSSGIASAVEEQTATTSEISSNMQMASSGVLSMTENINQITSEATNADVAAGEVLDASRMLSEQAEKLNKEVGGFLIKIRA